jgi:hypothetical protein
MYAVTMSQVRRLSAAALFAGVVLTSTGCASALSPTRQPAGGTPLNHSASNAALISFVSAEWGYRMSYPSGWSEESAEADRFHPADSSFFLSITHVHLIPELLSEAAYEADSQAQYAKTGAHLESTSRYPVGGADGLLSSYVTRS